MPIASEYKFFLHNPMAHRRMNQNSFGKLALGALMLAAIAGLAGCGGSSSSTPATTTSSLLASPTSFVAFGNTPNTVGISGGKGPYTVRSSDTSILPVPSSIAGASFTFTPNNVATATPVTLTVTDSAAATSVVTVTVTPATITSGLIQITPATGSTCAATNNPAITVATMCAGELGTASVTLRNNLGAVLPNREVRFEVLTIGATVAPTPTTAVFSRIATVNTNAQGVATVSIKADIEISSETAFLRATDVTSTHRVDTWITVLKQKDGASVLSMVPTTGGMQGHFSNECPNVRREFSIYGGKAPYAITLPAANTLVLANETAAAAPGGAITVPNSGGRFTVESAESTSCTTASTALTITDALGVAITGAYTVAPGTNARPAATTDLLVSPPTISITADPLSTYCASSSTRYTISGGTAPYAVSASIPQIVTSLSGGTTVNVSFVSDPKWKMLKGQNASILVLDSAGKVGVATLSCV
jgi:hypothetical protein